MKKLILITIVLILCSCSSSNSDFSWYKTGHIDEDNPCTFIVNDSIKIIAEETNTNNLKYFVYVNGTKIKHTYSYHSIFSDKKELIEYLKWQYEKGPRIIKPSKKYNFNDCFKNFDK